MQTTIVLSIGSFLIILGLLVLLRARNSKFEVRPSDVVVAVVPVIVFLLVTGRLQKFEIGEGGVKIETAFVKASESAITSQITPLTGLPAEPLRLDPKRGVEEIPRLIEMKTEGLLFRLGQGGYWGPAIEEYFTLLAEQPFLRYLIIEDADGAFFAVASARELTAIFKNPRAPFGAKDFAEWLNTSDKKSLQRLPGFIAADGALTQAADKKQALQLMEDLNADTLPVIDDNKRFAGVVNRSRVTASLLLEISQQLKQ